MDPLQLIKDAISAVPAVKYALAVAALGATVAIVAGFRIDLKIAVFGILIVLGLMFVMVLFSKFAEVTGPELKPLMLTLAWAFVVLTISSSLLVITGFFFSWPRSLGDYVNAGGKQSGYVVEHLAEELDLIPLAGANPLANRTFSVSANKLGEGEPYQDRLYTSAERAECAMAANSNTRITCREVPRIDSWTTHEFLLEAPPDVFKPEASFSYKLTFAAARPDLWVAKWFRYGTRQYTAKIMFDPQRPWKAMRVTLVKSGSPQPDVLQETTNGQSSPEYSFDYDNLIPAQSEIKFSWTN
jgi:hypothetical protein